MASTFTTKIAATADDGRNTAPATGADTWASTSLYAGIVGAKQSAMGLRFNNVTIPKGSTILSASIGLTPKETDADLRSAKIYGVAIDDAAAWGDSNLPIDLGDAPDNSVAKTTAKTEWPIPAISYTPYSTYTTYDSVPHYISVPHYATASASQTKAPGTSANSSVVGTFDWTGSSLNSVKTEDGVYTRCNDSNNNAISHALKVSNFGFTVPSNATIAGVTLRIKKYEEASSTNAVDSTVKLLKAGSLSGNNKSSGTEWPTSNTNTYYGASNDIWGNSLTYSDVNSSDFGAALSVLVGNSNESVFVDYMELTVSYTYQYIDYYDQVIDYYTQVPTVHTTAEAVFPITTPDISTVVKEITDRAGWTAGSDMAFVILPNAGTTDWDKVFFDYTDSATYAASLAIVYTDATYAVNLSSDLFAEDEKAHVCIAGNDYAFGRLSPSYPLALAGTFTQALTAVDIVAQMGILTFVAGDDGSTRPVFAKTATTYINNYGEMTIETPVVEGEFDGIKIHFGTNLTLNSSTLSSWIQVYTKYDNESAWSVDPIELVAESAEQFIEGFVTTEKNLQLKIVVDPIDTSTPNKITKIEFY